MIATVAVGTDGSETASKAVDVAIDLAHHYGAKLIVVSAYPRKESGEAQSASSGDASQTERVLAMAEESASERGVECTSAMAAGDPAEVLVNLAEKHGADLLVVGNKGMHRRLLGSVPNSVTHQASCSVFVVKTT